MQHTTSPVHPLITKDPVTGEALRVTRLEGSNSGVVIEGQFSLGWIGRLTPEQLAFAGLLLKHRGNLQKMASELNMVYNTARNRLDEIVAALEGPPPKLDVAQRDDLLEQLAAGTISFDEAMSRLQR